MIEKLRPSLWMRNALTRIVILTVSLLLVVGIMQWARPVVEGANLVLIGGFIAVLPAGVWLGVYYLQNRTESHRKTMIPQVFIVSALLAAAVGIPIVRDLFRVQDWSSGDRVTEILGSILIIGFTQEFLKFAAVRWSVYPTSEIRERMDAIIYATIASLGFSTVLNLNYVFDHPRLDLAVGVISVTVTALSQAAFADVLGYFMGRSKFDGGAVYRLPLGLAFAATLNGLFNYARYQVAEGLIINLTNALIMGIVFAALTLSFTLSLMNRVHQTATVRIESSKLDRYASFLLIAVAIIALSLGGSLKGYVETRTRSFQSVSAGISFNYPADWLQRSEEGTLILLTDP